MTVSSPGTVPGREGMAVRQTNLRALAEGALMAAICVVLGLSGYYLPVLGAAATLVGPVPIVVVYLRQGVRTAVLTAVVAGALLGAFLGPVQALVMGFAFGVLGLALGAGFRRQVAASTCILWAALAVGASLAVSLSLGFLFLHISPLDTVEEMLKAYEAAADIWARMGAGAQMVEQMRAMAANMRQLFWQMWPAALAGALFLAAALNWTVARALLRRLGYPTPAPAPFAEWRIPRWLLIPFGLSFALMLLHRYYPWLWLERTGINLNILLSWVFAVPGAAVAWQYLRRWVSGAAGFLAVALVLMLGNLVLLLIVWVGVMDTLFDYRRLGQGALERRGANNHEGDTAV